jgi:hypothetical protein
MLALKPEERGTPAHCGLAVLWLSRVPEPKLRTRCTGWSSPGLYQAFTLGGHHRVVPSCTRSSRGVVARPVSNLVSIGVPVPSGRGRLRRSGPPRPGTDRPAGHGKADKSLDPCMPCSFGLLPHPRSEPGAQPYSVLGVTVSVRRIPLVTAAYGTRVARPARTTMLGRPGCRVGRIGAPDPRGGHHLLRMRSAACGIVSMSPR